jgi:hypothetical protein
MIVLIVEAVAFQISTVATNRDWQMDVAASNEYEEQRLAEGLVISNATVSSSGADLALRNVGIVAAYIDYIWVNHTSFERSVSVPPGANFTYPLYTSPLTLDPAKTYLFKAVTSRGNIAQFWYPLDLPSTTKTGTTMNTTIGTTSYTTVSTTSSTTVSTTSYTTTSTTISTTSYTTVSTNSYTTSSTTSYTTVSTTSSTTSYTTVSTTSYTTTSTTISTTSYTTVSTTSYTTISTTSYTTINNNSPNMISGTLLIAYNGTDKSATDSCHTEGKTILSISGSPMYFVNPWLTYSNNNGVLYHASQGSTSIYYLVNGTNTMSTSMVASGGTIDLTWYGSNHVTGTLLGVYYNDGVHGWLFYPATSNEAIAPGRLFYAIFKTLHVELSSFSVPNFFIGSAAITNSLEGSTYYSAQLAIDGLWVRSYPAC